MVLGIIELSKPDCCRLLKERKERKKKGRDRIILDWTWKKNTGT